MPGPFLRRILRKKKIFTGEKPEKVAGYIVFFELLWYSVLVKIYHNRDGAFWVFAWEDGFAEKRLCT